jgi:hypothetical protein
MLKSTTLSSKLSLLYKLIKVIRSGYVPTRPKVEERSFVAKT